MTMVGSSVPVDNSLNPARRETIVHFIHTRSWKDGVPRSVVDSAFHNTPYITGEKLRQLAPSIGAYISEGSCSSSLPSTSKCGQFEIDLVQFSFMVRHQRIRLAVVLLRAKLPPTLPDQTEVRPRTVSVVPTLPRK